MTLHLQLPADTTLQSWFSSNNYDQLWTLTSSAGNELIFVAPTLPAGFGDQLEVRAGIAPSLGSKVQLSSTAWIETSGDTDTNNNGPDTQDAWTTSEPRPDLGVDKQWAYGILAPGGLAWYQINYSNDGSLTQAGVRLTDTLPAGTHFVEATVDSNWGFSQSVPPAYQSGNVLAWDLGTLPAASWGHLKVKLALDDVAAGATITNTAHIGGQDNDLTWFNNYSAAVEHVNGAGANLRLHQSSWWEWPGQVRFDLQFENAGTTIVKDVRITDTVPTGLDFNGDWWHKWGGDLTYSYNPATRQIVWTINQLEPANTGSISMHFNVPQADIGHQGLQYTNIAQITQPAGEVSPADNSTTMLAFSGPDLFVQKTLWSGEVAPDALVTFAIDFGNRNNGPWSTGQPAPSQPGRRHHRHLAGRHDVRLGNEPLVSGRQLGPATGRQQADLGAGQPLPRLPQRVPGHCAHRRDGKSRDQADQRGGDSRYRARRRGHLPGQQHVVLERRHRSGDLSANAKEVAAAFPAILGTGRSPTTQTARG